MQVIDSEGYLKVKLIGGPAGPFVPYTGATTDVDLGTHSLTARNIIVNHPSGSGVAVSITKGGAGEALTVVKTSGSGNAMSVTGGNVAIGTTTDAGFKLDVNGTARFAGNTTFGSGTSQPITFTHVTDNYSQIDFIDNVNSRSAFIRGARNAQYLSIGFPGTSTNVNFSPTIVNIGLSKDFPLPLQVNGTPATTITSAGQVRVSGSTNTTNTGAKLAFLCGADDSTNATDSGGILVLKTNTFGSGTNSRMLFYNIQGTTLTERMRIDDTGNVAIGTTTAFEKLQLNGGICFGTSNNATINSGIGAGNHTYLQFATLGVNVMRISANQNVLIGTTTDAGYKLDVNGNTRIKGLGTSSATTGFIVQNSSSQSLFEIQDDGGAFVGRSGGTTWAMTFRANTGVNGRIGNGFFETPPTIQTYDFNTTMTFRNNFRDGAGFLYTFANVQVSATTTTAMIELQGTYANQNDFQFANLKLTPTYNFNANTTSNAIARGIYYNPTITNLRTATHYAFHSTSGRIRFEGLPTSPVGLSSGDVWNNLGILSIV
jgi:hypothetical protein